MTLPRVSRQFFVSGAFILVMLYAAGAPTHADEPKTGEDVLVINKKTDRCLTIGGGASSSNNVEAVQFGCDGAESRKWRLLRRPNSHIYQIRNVHTGKCLTIAGGVSTDNNVTAVQFDCDNDASRTWVITDVTGSGLYQLKNAKTGKCLTIAGGVSAANNVPALQFNCDTDLSRHWQIKDAGHSID